MRWLTQNDGVWYHRVLGNESFYLPKSIYFPRDELRAYIHVQVTVFGEEVTSRLRLGCRPKFSKLKRSQSAVVNWFHFKCILMSPFPWFRSATFFSFLYILYVTAQVKLVFFLSMYHHRYKVLISHMSCRCGIQVIRSTAKNRWAKKRRSQSKMMHTSDPFFVNSTGPPIHDYFFCDRLLIMDNFSGASDWVVKASWLH